MIVPRALFRSGMDVKDMKRLLFAFTALLPAAAWAQPVTFGMSGGAITANGAALATSSALAAETTRATTAESALLPTTGDASATTVTPTGGTTARTLATRAVDIYYARDSGANSTGATDATAALQAWMNAAAAAGAQRFVIGPDQYLVGTAADLIVPAGLTVVGPWGRPGEIGNSDDYTATPGSLIVASGHTIRMSQGSALDGLVVRRQGLIPVATLADAYTEIAAMAGTAITIGTSIGTDVAPDVTLRNLFILGFNQAIYSNGNGRLRVENVSGDNINGVHIDNSQDISRVIRTHFWPFLTVGITNTSTAIASSSIVGGYWQIVTSAPHGFSTGQTVIVSGHSETQLNGYSSVTVINPTTLQLPISSGSGTGTGGTVNSTIYLRNGIAHESDTNNSYSNWEQDFSFGYKTGYSITNSQNVVMHDIAADNNTPSGDWGAVGLDLEGTTNEASISDCRMSGQHTGILVNTPSGVQSVMNCWQWGTFGSNVNITAGAITPTIPGTLSVNDTILNSNNSLVVSNTLSGPNIHLEGNGGTTPDKYIRARNGAFNIVNSGYTANLLTLDDAGDLSVPGSMTATTPPAGNNSTTVATTAAVMANLYYDVQTFSSTGTWTKPAFCSYTGITCVSFGRLIGGGPGGSGGAMETLGTVGTGGGSGGGAACIDWRALTANYTGTVTVTIGTGGAGGAGATTNGPGTVGSVGNNSTFGSYKTAYTGGLGGPGETAAASAGGASGGLGGVGNNASGSTAGTAQPYVGTVAGTAAGYGAVNPSGAQNSGGSGATTAAGVGGTSAPCVSGAGTGGTLLASSATAGGLGGSAIGATGGASGAYASSGTAGTGGNAVGNGDLFPATAGPGGGGANTGGLGGSGGGAATGAYGCSGGGGGAGTTGGGAGGAGCGGYAVVVTQGYSSGL